VIKMAKAQYIKHLYENEGKSKNEIRRITGLNYRTVCRYVEKTDWNAKKEPNMKAEHYPILGEYAYPEAWRSCKRLEKCGIS